jgi:hypothetical protein
VTSDEPGAWDPLTVGAVFALFREAPFRWWISGGHALEQHLDRSWRSHDDIDIGIVRSDATKLGSTLRGWDIHVAAAGRLTPWRVDDLAEALHQNNLWCRRTPGGPWLLDVTINAGNEREWVYRRDSQIRIPWDDAVHTSAAGVPYLAPELQLLFKSTHPRDKDDIDALEVIPALDGSRRGRLARLLPAQHPWQRLLAT